MKRLIILFTLRSWLFTVLMISGLSLFSQNFNGGIIGGISASQISGDNLDGYDHLGLDLGGFVNLYTHNNIAFQMEIKFIQKGSRSQLGIGDTSASQRYIYLLRLNYIEMPLICKYDLKGLSHYAVSDSSFHLLNKLSVEVGLAMAFLISSTEEDASQSLTLYTPPFKPTDFSGLIGLYYHISDNVAVNLRWTHSILPVRPHNLVGPLPSNIPISEIFNQGQYNNVLEFTLHIQLNKRIGQ